MMILKGNLAREPELRYVGTERMALVSGTIFAYRGKTLQGDTLSDVPVPFSAWGSQAHFIMNNYKKGEKINVVGDLQLDTYDKDGVSIQKLCCVVKAVLDDDTQKLLFSDVMTYCRMANEANLEIPDRLNLTPSADAESGQSDDSYYAPIEGEC